MTKSPKICILYCFLFQTEKYTYIVSCSHLEGINQNDYINTKTSTFFIVTQKFIPE